MTEKRTQFTRGRQQDILAYFFENPTKDITIGQLEKVFKSRYDRTKIMATMAHLCNEDVQKKYNYPIARVTTGVWRLSIGVEAKVNTVTPEEAVEVAADQTGEPIQPEGDYKPIIGQDMMLVEVLKEKDTYILVEDTNDGKIYKMILVG